MRLYCTLLDARTHPGLALGNLALFPLPDTGYEVGKRTEVELSRHEELRTMFPLGLSDWGSVREVPRP